MSTVEGTARRPLWARLPTGTRAIGYLGILLGLLAFYVAIPPLVTRTPVVPIVLGFFAVAAGIWVVTRAERRLGWGAVASGILGIAGGILATRSSTDHLHEAVEWGVLTAATLRFATPLIYAAMGGILCERCPGPAHERTGISLESLKLLKAYQRLDIEAIATLRLAPDVERETEAALREFVRVALERDARSLAFLDEVRTPHRRAVPDPAAT